jgi:hypothetical protein
MLVKHKLKNKTKIAQNKDKFMEKLTLHIYVMNVILIKYNIN